MNLPYPATEFICRRDCRGAVEMWSRSRQPGYGQNQSPQYPAPTDKQQGPFRLKGGGWKFIAPLASPLPTPAPTSPQGLTDPPGPFSLFAGAGISATTASNQPPDVAADVSSTQNVEFINGFSPNAMGLTNTTGGLYVYNKTGVQKKFTETVSFWCGSNGVNNRPLTGCVTGPPPSETLQLVDTQVAFDPALGLWIATQMALSSNATQANPSQVYLAVSNTSDATGTWTKWSLPVCNTDTTNNVADQPLLGWSSALVAINATCGLVNVSGPDNLILILNSTITSHAAILPAAIAAPCSNMTPARDETSNFANLYLLASIVPQSNGDTRNLSTCAPNAHNAEPYILEYTATTNGTTATVSGSSGACPSGSSCSPVSTSFQDGMPGTYPLLTNAQQMIAPAYNTVCANAACDIGLGDARITSAQIRSSSNGSGTNLPILTAAFDTGIASGPPFSQALAFLQDLSSGNWIGTVNVSDSVNGWVAYLTIALDDDGAFNYAFTTFGQNILPTSTWAGVTGYLSSSPLGEGSGTLESSSSTYTGQAGTGIGATNGPQRWGDYNTMVYDPSEIGPGGEGSFWQIEETSNGGADQSTTWFALADPTPLPSFVGSSIPTGAGGQVGEAECVNACSLTYTPPANPQLGDVFIATILLGGNASSSNISLPPGWTLLHLKNLSNATALRSSDATGSETGFVAVYVYGSQGLPDPGTYTVGITPTTGGEADGFLVSYRGASTTTTNYLLYGKGATSDNNAITTLKLSPTNGDSPPGETTLLDLFSLNCIHTGGEDAVQYAPFSAISGSPAVTRETPLNSQNGFLAADAPVLQSGKTFGAYQTSVACGVANLPMAWQLVITEFP